MVHGQKISDVSNLMSDSTLDLGNYLFKVHCLERERKKDRRMYRKIKSPLSIL